MIIQNKMPNKKGAKGSWEACATQRNMSGRFSDHNISVMSEMVFRVFAVILGLFALVYFGLHLLAPQVFR